MLIAPIGLQLNVFIHCSGLDLNGDVQVVMVDMATAVGGNH